MQRFTSHFQIVLVFFGHIQQQVFFDPVRIGKWLPSTMVCVLCRRLINVVTCPVVFDLIFKRRLSVVKSICLCLLNKSSANTVRNWRCDIFRWKLENITKQLNIAALYNRWKSFLYHILLLCVVLLSRHTRIAKSDQCVATTSPCRSSVFVSLDRIRYEFSVKSSCSKTVSLLFFQATLW